MVILLLKTVCKQNDKGNSTIKVCQGEIGERVVWAHEHVVWVGEWTHFKQNIYRKPSWFLFMVTKKSINNFPLT